MDTENWRMSSQQSAGQITESRFYFHLVRVAYDRCTLKNLCYMKEYINLEILFPLSHLTKQVCSNLYMHLAVSVFITSVTCLGIIYCISRAQQLP